MWKIPTAVPGNAELQFGESPKSDRGWRPCPTFRPEVATPETQVLEVETPEVLHRILQFDSKLPPRRPFVPSPNQIRIARILVDQVDHPHLLPHRKRVRSEEHTSELQSRRDLVC